MAETGHVRIGSKFRPKKRLGQHFIQDKKIIQLIIDGGSFKKSDCVLEVGPGMGALTIPLAGHVNHIIAIEKDSHLARNLIDRISSLNIKNITVINHKEVL